MGLLDPLDMHWIYSTKELREKLKNGVEQSAQALSYLKHIVGSGEEYNRLLKYEEGLGKAGEWLSMPETVVENIAAAYKITRGFKHLSKIGNIRNDPEGAAWAFGKIFKGIGDLSSHLPAFLGAYLSIFSEAENFFLDIRHKMSEKTHFKQWPTIMDDI
jgi:hypothetical protein